MVDLALLERAILACNSSWEISGVLKELVSEKAGDHLQNCLAREEHNAQQIRNMNREFNNRHLGG